MCSPDAMQATGGYRGPGMGKTGLSLIKGEGNTNTYLNMFGVPADQQQGSDAYVDVKTLGKSLKNLLLMLNLVVTGVLGKDQEEAEALLNNKILI